MGVFGAERILEQMSAEGSKGGRKRSSFSFLVNRTVLFSLLILLISLSLFWLVWIYGNSLRDPRYLDGWILAGGMILQWQFHFAVKAAALSPVSVKRLRWVHIFIGYLLVAAFVSHCDFSLPDTGFEWALWIGFILIILSGILNTYLSWSLSARHNLSQQISYDQIPARRAELAHAVQVAVTQTNSGASALALPAPSYDTWISDLYTNHLRDFFQGPRNHMAHILGSQRPRNELIAEIDNLSVYVDANSQKILTQVKELVVEKDKLDFARVYLGLTRGCLFVHVPVTYALTVITFMHVIVVYAFSSGDW